MREFRSHSLPFLTLLSAVFTDNSLGFFFSNVDGRKPYTPNLCSFISSTHSRRRFRVEHDIPITTNLRQERGIPKVYPTSLLVVCGASPLDDFDRQRRNVWKKSIPRIASTTIGLTALTLLTRPVWGANTKSRTDGYAVQKTEEEWRSTLSPMQYYILREGGTERPGFSVLEKEKRRGTYFCAGCGSALFSSADKFNSRTGWPSFSRGLDAVEVEDVGVVAASLGGAELRCATCGGHLGDVFRDGFLFAGTSAALTGKRFCIDGGALVFEPDEPSAESKKLRGDIPAPPKPLPNFLESPRIEPKD